jgi:hypothetical protein
VPEHAVAGAKGDAIVTRETLALAEPPEQRTQLETYLREHIAAALGLPPVRLDPRQPVNTLGLDSLMIYEMKRRVRADLGVALPAVRFFEKVTIPDLASELSIKLAAPTDEGPTGPTPAVHRKRRPVPEGGFWKGLAGRVRR